MRIRLFRPEDLDTIRALTITAFEAVSIDRNIEKQFGMIHGHDWRWRKARQIDEDVACSSGTVFVAEADGKVIGYITTRSDRDSGMGHIPNLAVAAEARGQGLGRQLIQHALAFLRGQGMTHVKIETLDQNDIGRHLYPSCGFQEVARQIHYVTQL